ncbi:Hypothetical predicted protein, partial [Paramuricea clavata]
MGGQNLEVTPHMKFFWQQQMKLLQTVKMARRYHPQIIRFALSLHGKSPAAYRELRDSGVLILPSEIILRDYKNYFKPKADYIILFSLNLDNIESLREKASSAAGIQRYVVLVMDEMKIQSNLVFDNKMKVKLATQVLSRSVAIALEESGNEEVLAYTAQDDERFVWMKNVFLQYLENWRQSTVTRDGVYSTDDRGKMFLSIQTYK